MVLTKRLAMILESMADKGLILDLEKKGKKMFDMSVNEEVCIGENCGCNRLCTRILKCPGLVWDNGKKTARIDEVICAGCGVCASICPSGAIEKKEVA